MAYELIYDAFARALFTRGGAVLLEDVSLDEAADQFRDVVIKWVA